ncbi:MAG: hypothetical protein VX223_02675 [Myxococcota bacterium]|nr:hypothetical protein [Myxococcota bacterium]
MFLFDRMIHRTGLVTSLSLLFVLSCETGSGAESTSPGGDDVSVVPDTLACEFFEHPDREVCVQCLEDDDCLSGHCEPKSFQCVSCYSDSHCSGGVCLPEQFFCVECFDDLHCGSGVCDVPQYRCIGCGTDSDCDDTNDCTAEQCVDGSCQYAVNVGQVCDLDPCVDEVCTDDAVCTSVGVDTAGACELACQNSSDCPDGQWCRPEGGCGTDGVCLDFPSECETVGLVPVCGCDSQTYKSECNANLAGISVAYTGACDCIGDACCEGTDCCPSAPACDAGQLVDTTGDDCVDTCCAIPPVCALPPIDTNGDGCVETCPCSLGTDCPVGSYCKTDDCGALGSCLPCSLQISDETVCTCGGTKTSIKAVCAQQSKSIVSSAKVCCPDPPICEFTNPVDTTGDGCLDSCGCSETGCEANEFCVPNGCGATDSICAPCLTDTGTVCGCDGITYDSQCSASQFGVPVAYGGPCECSADGEPCAGADQVCDVKGCDDGTAGQCVTLAPSGIFCGCDGLSYSGIEGLKESGVAFAYTGCCVITCELGATPVDTNGDSCPDVCKTGCVDGSECSSGLCLRSNCEDIGLCSPVDASLYECEGKCTCKGVTLGDDCAAPGTGMKMLTIDLSGASCAQLCPFLPPCSAPAVPVDTDGDGCPEKCL